MSSLLPPYHLGNNSLACVSSARGTALPVQADRKMDVGSTPAQLLRTGRPEIRRPPRATLQQFNPGIDNPPPPVGGIG